MSVNLKEKKKKKKSRYEQLKRMMGRLNALNIALPIGLKKELRQEDTLLSAL